MCLCCVLCGYVVGCVVCRVVLRLDELSGRRGRPSADLGSHWTAGLGNRKQAPRARRAPWSHTNFL